jgi:hypothetical protein
MFHPTNNCSITKCQGPVVAKALRLMAWTARPASFAGCLFEGSYVEYGCYLTLPATRTEIQQHNSTIIHLSLPSHTKCSVNLTHATVQNVLAISKSTPSRGSGKDQAQKLNLTMNIKEALITYRSDPEHRSPSGQLDAVCCINICNSINVIKD